jgi:hypothetical protein
VQRSPTIIAKYVKNLPAAFAKVMSNVRAAIKSTTVFMASLEVEDFTESWGVTTKRLFRKFLSSGGSCLTTALKKVALYFTTNGIK